MQYIEESLKIEIINLEAGDIFLNFYFNVFKISSVDNEKYHFNLRIRCIELFDFLIERKFRDLNLLKKYIKSLEWIKSGGD